MLHFREENSWHTKSKTNKILLYQIEISSLQQKCVLIYYYALDFEHCSLSPVPGIRGTWLHLTYSMLQRDCRSVNEHLSITKKNWESMFYIILLLAINHVRSITWEGEEINSLPNVIHQSITMMIQSQHRPEKRKWQVGWRTWGFLSRLVLSPPCSNINIDSF